MRSSGETQVLTQQRAGGQRERKEQVLLWQAPFRTAPLPSTREESPWPIHSQNAAPCDAIV